VFPHATEEVCTEIGELKTCTANTCAQNISPTLFALPVDLACL
jgi:hypothetical protein